MNEESIDGTMNSEEAYYDFWRVMYGNEFPPKLSYEDWLHDVNARGGVGEVDLKRLEQQCQTTNKGF